MNKRNRFRGIRNIPLSKRERKNFIRRLKKGAALLDIGCGNNSAYVTKSMRSDLYYAGADISDYNNADGLSYADECIMLLPDQFAQGIKDLGRRFDAVISNHNLEHCNDPDGTLAAMCDVLKKKGMMYLAFPSAKSVYFPHREGTLNFYDDSTHREVPDFHKIIQILRKNGMEILFSAESYRPLLKCAWGG